MSPMAWICPSHSSLHSFLRSTPPSMDIIPLELFSTLIHLDAYGPLVRPGIPGPYTPHNAISQNYMATTSQRIQTHIHHLSNRDAKYGHTHPQRRLASVCWVTESVRNSYNQVPPQDVFSRADQEHTHKLLRTLPQGVSLLPITHPRLV